MRQSGVLVVGATPLPEPQGSADPQAAVCDLLHAEEDVKSEGETGVGLGGLAEAAVHVPSQHPGEAPLPAPVSP